MYISIFIKRVRSAIMNRELFYLHTQLHMRTHTSKYECMCVCI